MNDKIEKKCSICDIPYFERNHYFFGKLMTVRDFSAEQRYFNEKRWLINRMINGWGIVCGLDVKKYEGNGGKVIVTPGLAIDCCGREILVCEEQTVDIVQETSECHTAGKNQNEGRHTFVICLEYFECRTELINLPPIACDGQERHEHNRVRDSFRIRVLPEDECQPEESCEETCPLEDKDAKLAPLHEYLCEKQMRECGECPKCPCLVLARVTLTPSEKYPDNPLISIDPCAWRKLVYTNPDLFDLIDCFHGNFPHVTRINWVENGHHMTYQEFKETILPPDFGETDASQERQAEGSARPHGVMVQFDRKMNGDTINDHTFMLKVLMEEAETGNYRYEMVPGEVKYFEDREGVPTAAFQIKSAWLKDVYFGYSRVREKGGRFVVVLKGDFILSAGDDCIPIRALDGNFIAGKLPSGNGTQGGDFESWFFVGPKDSKGYDAERRSWITR